jgi:hypothetical protein
MRPRLSRFGSLKEVHDVLAAAPRVRTPDGCTGSKDDLVFLRLENDSEALLGRNEVGKEAVALPQLIDGPDFDYPAVLEHSASVAPGRA